MGSCIFPIQDLVLLLNGWVPIPIEYLSREENSQGSFGSRVIQKMVDLVRKHLSVEKYHFLVATFHEFYFADGSDFRRSEATGTIIIRISDWWCA